MAGKPDFLSRVSSFIKRKTSQKYRFDMQYQQKKWDGLNGLPELAHYSIIVGYVNHFLRQPRILDLGCGEGVMLQKFRSSEYSAYVGIDFSQVAIDNARALENDKVRFRVGDLNSLVVDGVFDAIIYNESLYYLSDPKQAVRSLFKNLAPGGIFIISMVDKHGKERTGIWSELDEILELKDRTKVANRDGGSWTIAVYQRGQ